MIPRLTTPPDSHPMLTKAVAQLEEALVSRGTRIKVHGADPTQVN